MTKTTDPRDLQNMLAALALGRRALGNAWPNPAVGCVLVHEDEGGRVVGRGWTQPGGRPHAETEALGRAGKAARGATAYVTLEPCDHHGQTPPCSEALIAAGIARAVVAIEDPDPRTARRGLARLEKSGVDVVLGVGKGEAEDLNAGFFMRLAEGRPLFTLKCGTSLDGRIATGGGESQWITGEAARDAAHRLRATHDAVLIGSGTALADDPELTCRLPGLEGRSPVRIVVDGRLRLPAGSRIVKTAPDVPTWLVTLASYEASAKVPYVAAGIEIIEAPPGADGSPDLEWQAGELGGRGLTRVLVEGGGRLAASLLGAGLADRLAWFRAPLVIGGDGVPAAAGFGVERLGDAPRFVRMESVALGADILETYRRPV